MEIGDGQWREVADAEGAVVTEGFIMLYTIAVILVVLWLLGFAFHVAGGLIHLLLVIAVIVVLVNFISGRRGP
jgi:hypothetical protein